ncbi:MAG TPA: NlpC/P60 family protein [Ignavibacteriales bacterium]|nr:NlpC/P60 family protein [Ignavibacteriales bacterium]
MKSFSASSLFTLFIIAAALIFFRGCSASSYSSRTDKSGTEKKSASKDVRFTDEDDGSPEKTDADPAPHSPRIEEEFEEMEIGTIERDQEIKAEYIKKYISTSSSGELRTRNMGYSETRDKMLMEIVKYLDTPYKYGGNSTKGIDCSAFTKNVYAGAEIGELPRSAREQYAAGIDVDQDDLQFGDLVFFNTRRRVKPGHVGIYLGDGYFVHSSRSLGVAVSSLSEPYYSKRYMGARRTPKN